MKHFYRNILLTGVAAMITSVTLDAAALDAARINYWTLDEGSGEIFHDSSVIRNLPGSFHNGEWCEGVQGNAMRFNGIDSYAATPAATTFYTPEGLSVDFYFYIERVAGLQYIVCSEEWFVRLVDDTVNCGWRVGSNWKENIASVRLEQNRWYRLTWSCDATTARIYLDGEPVGSADTFGIVLSNSAPLRLGRPYWIDNEGYFAGRVDEISVYNRALTAEEIAPVAPEVAETRRLERQLAELETRFERQRHFVSVDMALETNFARVRQLLQQPAPDNVPAAALLETIREALPQTPVSPVSERLHWYAINPFSAQKTLPDTPEAALPGQIADRVTLIGAPGEYEAAGWVIRAVEPLPGLRFGWSDLTSPEGNVIPAAEFDLKVVAAWTQDGGAWSVDKQTHRPSPVPELLLHDPAFLERRFDQMPLEDGLMPIRDAATLQPVDIAAGTNRQFHLTLRIPENTVPGLYQGDIQVTDAAGNSVAAVPVQLRVLSFPLAPALTRNDPEQRFASGIYYWGQLAASPAQIAIGGFPKNERQLRAEFANLARHGIDSPILVWYQDVMHNPDLLRRGLIAARDAGLLNHAVYFGISGYTDAETPEELEQLRQRVTSILAQIRELGITGEVYFYGSDEARGDKLTAQRPAIDAIHQAGAKVLVSGFTGIFDVLGDYLDIVNWYGAPDANEAAQWHRNGRRIWNYGSPQAGAEDPEIYRRNFGFYLWQRNYDGVSDYCYADPFAPPYYRGFNFVYPTIDDVIDTLPWEAFREALDDIRYASTLTLAIRQAQASGTPKAIAIAAEAEQFLAGVDTAQCDPDWLRLRVVRYILQLREAQ